MRRIEDFKFCNLKIRNKLVLVLSGTIAVLTVILLLVVGSSVLHEVNEDVHQELTVAVDNLVLSEGKRLDDEVLRAMTLVRSAPVDLRSTETGEPCVWAANLLRKGNSNPRLSSPDMVALQTSSGALTALALRGSPACDPRTSAWTLPRPRHPDRPSVTNWEAPPHLGQKEGDLYQMVEVPTEPAGSGQVLVLGFVVSDRFADHMLKSADRKRPGDESTGLVVWHKDGGVIHQHGVSGTMPSGLINAEAASGIPPTDSHRFMGYSIKPAPIEYTNVNFYYDNPQNIHVSIVQRLSVRYAPYYRLGWTMGGIGLLMLGVGVVAGLLVSHPIATPLVTLAYVAEAVANGDLEAAHQLIHKDGDRTASTDEVGVLSRSFLGMVKGLRERLAMARFLSDATKEHIRRQGIDASTAEVERRSMVVLFSDIRNFTDFSETQDPALVIALLNEVLSLQTCIAEDHGGDINKFIGDALFAWFEGEGRCARAIDAANDMVAALDARFGGRAGTTVGIGIHVGDMVVGSVGSPDRKDYTAIGAAVNLAARLCSNAGRGQILTSEAVALELAASTDATRLPLHPLQPIHLKGFVGMMTVYEANQTVAVTGDATVQIPTSLPLAGTSMA